MIFQTLFMLDWYSRQVPPSIILVLGFVSLFGAVVSTCTGVTLARFSGWVYRAKEPNEFWWIVAIYYVGGVLFIGIFLCS